MSNLATRFSTTPAEVQSKVKEAITDFRSMGTVGGAPIQVYVRPGDVMYSCYRFGTQQAVIVLYSHTKERQSYVPAFVVDGGSLFSFVRKDIDAIAEESRLAP